MATLLDNDSHFSSHLEQYQQVLPQHYRTILSDFRKCSRSFIVFNAIFAGVAAFETLLCFCFWSWLSDSALLALIIGALFLTGFSYLTLLFYFQAKKPEQLSELLDRFVASCRTSLGLPAGIAQHHLSLAETLIKLSQYLTDDELIRAPKLFAPIISRYYLRDLFAFKQQLLQAAIGEHLNQIRLTPTDLEVHASLANAYVALSGLYKEPSGGTGLKFYKKNAPLFAEKFKVCATLAIEEFQILNDYAPNDPWIHEQLAASYRDLGLPLEEIREVELLLKLRSNDRDVLFRLGTLYFEQGFNAKGLQVYEELKKGNFKQAEELVSVYGQAFQLNF